MPPVRLVMLSAFMVWDIGEKGGRYMKAKIKYTEEPMGELKIVKDFLPKPEELALKEENVKITISLNKSSVEFFSRKRLKSSIRRIRR